MSAAALAVAALPLSVSARTVIHGVLLLLVAIVLLNRRPRSSDTVVRRAGLVLVLLAVCTFVASIAPSIQTVSDLLMIGLIIMTGWTAAQTLRRPSVAADSATPQTSSASTVLSPVSEAASSDAGGYSSPAFPFPAAPTDRRRESTASGRSQLPAKDGSSDFTSDEFFSGQQLLLRLFEQLPDAIYFKDSQSRFVLCNQQMADMFGLSCGAEFIGRCDHDFFPKEEADEYRRDELKILQSGQPLINKEEFETFPDGSQRWVLSTKLPLIDERGVAIGTFGLSRDITDLKTTQQALAKKINELEALHQRLEREQSLFSMLIENVPDAIFFKDKESRFIRVNPAMARDCGFDSPEDVIGLTDADLWDEELASAARRDEVRIMETGRPIIGKKEQVHRKDGGSSRWVLATKMPLRNESGEIIGTFGIARDITTLQLTQQWLQDSQERFELAARGTNDGLWDWNIETDEVWYSERFCELLGFDTPNCRDFPNLLSGFLQCIHPDDRERVMENIDAHLEGGPPHDQIYRMQLASGEYRWFRGRGQAKWDDKGRPLRMAGSIQDVHEQHETQAALRRVQQQLTQALQGGNVGLWDWDVVTNEIEVSPELMLQLGEDPEQPWTSLQDWHDHLHPEDRDAAIQRTRDYIDNVTQVYESSFRLRHVDGSWRWILSRGRIFRDNDGQPRRFIGVHVDITELREAEEALKKSEAKFRGIFHQTFQFIGLLNPNGNVLDVNQTALDGAGICREDVIGKKFWDTAWWSHSETLQQRLRQAIDRGAAGEFDRFEAEHPTPDGSSIIVDFSLKPVFDEQGQVMWLIPEGRNVTQLKEYERQLKARTDELERSNRELEQFAYVASHDLQEPLRTISGFCDLLVLEYGDKLDDEGRKWIRTIQDGAARMRTLISDLLEYSRVSRKGKAFEPTCLNDVLEQVQLLLYSAIEESGAELKIDPLPTIDADSGQMVRLFQNVLGNALKYRRNGIPPVVQITAEQHEDTVDIYVSDNGIGIPPEYAQQVFVVFRRLHTREEYPGTGIGLSVCRRIVERHGGTISIVYDDARRPDPEHGTTFRITLPTKHAETDAAPDAEPDSSVAN